MARAEFGLTIARPVGDVFAVLSNPRNSTKWSSSSLEMEVLTPGPIRVGSRRRGVAKGIGGRTIETEAEIIEYEEDRRIVAHTVRAAIPFTTAIDFKELDGATRVDWIWTFELRGPLRLVGPLIVLIFRRGFRRDLANLKAMMESGKL